MAARGSQVEGMKSLVNLSKPFLVKHCFFCFLIWKPQFLMNFQLVFFPGYHGSVCFQRWFIFDIPIKIVDTMLKIEMEELKETPGIINMNRPNMQKH